MSKEILSVFSLFLINCTNKQVETPKTEYLEAELVAEVTSIQPGVPFWVALRLQMEEGWHVNWENPGDAGLAPSVSWELPEGFSAGEIQWPNPKRLSIPPLVLFGYENMVLLPVEITPPPGLSGQEEITLSAACDWVVCGDVCIPGEAKLTLTLPVKNETPDLNASYAGEFSATRDKSPVINDIWNVIALASENSIVINVTSISEKYQPIESLVFFPDVQGLINNASEQKLTNDRIGSRLEIARDKMSQVIPDSLKGILIAKDLGANATKTGVRIKVPLTKEISSRN